MNAGPRKLLAFAAALGVAFGAAALAGAAIDPTDAGETAPADHGESAGSGRGESARSGHGESAGFGHGESAGSGHGESAGHEVVGEPAAGGLSVSAGGYTLRPRETAFASGARERFAFEIVDAEGRPVRAGYEPTHERELHLIAVRRDTATFQHLHPERATDGTWSTELAFPAPGTYRVFADFKLDGEDLILATDVFVPGEFAPEPLPAPTDEAEADGYAVELRGTEGLRAGEERGLTFVVTRDGEPVGDLEDYLGAKGHLVALREGDLAYLHVHPLEADSHSHGGEPSDAHANEVAFAATFPSAGSYRLFLQFKTKGEVRTIDYTVEVPR